MKTSHGGVVVGGNTNFKALRYVVFLKPLLTLCFLFSYLRFVVCLYVCFFLVFYLEFFFPLTFISLACVCEFGSPQNMPFCFVLFVFLGFCMITQFFHPWIVFDVVKIFSFSVGFKQCLKINALHVRLPPKKKNNL